MKVWVLTEEYDQHGAYFVAVFKDKPTRVQLAQYVRECAPSFTDFYTGHLWNGGGRVNLEDHWYNLEEVEVK